MCVALISEEVGREEGSVYNFIADVIKGVRDWKFKLGWNRSLAHAATAS